MMVAVVTRSVSDRFWEKVDKSGECWLWTGADNGHGYGYFAVDGRRSHAKMAAAHRVAYELLVGPIPHGMTLDHLCRVRRCVNPMHLEVVSLAENIRRSPSVASRLARTHCPQGHPYDEANTRIRLGGGRSCRACDSGGGNGRRQAMATRITHALTADDGHSALHFAGRLWTLGHTYTDPEGGEAA